MERLSGPGRSRTCLQRKYVRALALPSATGPGDNLQLVADRPVANVLYLESIVGLWMDGVTVAGNDPATSSPQKMRSA